jgi:hypothetical protein
MGYYVQTPDSQNKAEQLHRLYGAELVLSPEEFDFNGDYALICVVENGPFDAAGIAYDADERDSFNNPDDPRPKAWLKLPKETVIKLCPYVKDHL